MNKENLKNAEDAFLDKINQVCSKFGLNSIMAQIYAIAYFSKDPISLDNMVERLNISKGSASVNIRKLEGYGVVKKVWIRGSRKDYYKAESDLSKVFGDIIKTVTAKRLSEFEDMIDSAYTALGAKDAQDDNSEDMVNFKEKMEKLNAIRSKIKALTELINSDILKGFLQPDDKEVNKIETYINKA